MKIINIEATVPESLAGKRLDKILAVLFPDYSRSRLQEWVKSGCVIVDDEINISIKSKLVGGEQIKITTELQEQENFEAEDICLDIIYEDEDIAVINKPVGMVVHPAAGNWSGTMLNGLLYRYPDSATVPRAGIVHRLDKDTSGLLVVAKNIETHKNLIEQLQERTVSREYLALVNGYVTAGGTIDKNIGRHRHDRKKMAVVFDDEGKEAITHYRIEERLGDYTLIRAKLETGRTHQIRVHMTHINHPLAGDQVYGGRLKLPAGISEDTKKALREFKRQALHAWKLGLDHPRTGEYMEWQTELPEDMEKLLGILKMELTQ